MNGIQFFSLTSVVAAKPMGQNNDRYAATQPRCPVTIQRCGVANFNLTQHPCRKSMMHNWPSEVETEQKSKKKVTRHEFKLSIDLSIHLSIHPSICLPVRIYQHLHIASTSSTSMSIPPYIYNCIYIYPTCISLYAKNQPAGLLSTSTRCRRRSLALKKP